MNFVLKTKANPSSLLVPVQQSLQALDPRGVVFNVRPLKSAVMKLILGEGAVLAGAGLLIGIFASLALNQFIKSLLFAVSATDPLIYLLTATLVILIALLASGIPARRATKIDPIRTLRSD